VPQSALWKPGTTAPTVEADTIFSCVANSVADFESQDVRLNEDFLNYFDPATLKAALTTGPGTGKAIAKGADGGADHAVLAPEGVLPINQFTFAVPVRAVGADFSTVTRVATQSLVSITSGSMRLAVRWQHTAMLQLDLVIDGLAEVSPEITLSLGDLPLDGVYRWLWGTWDLATKTLTVALGDNLRTASAVTTGTPTNLPFSGLVGQQNFSVGGDQSGQPKMPLDVGMPLIYLTKRVYNTQVNLITPAATIDFTTPAGTHVSPGGMFQFAGWDDKLEDGQVGGGGPGVTGNAIRDAAMAKATADGVDMWRLEHAVDKVVVTGASPPFTYDYTKLDGELDAIPADAVLWVNTDYTPSILGASSATPPTNNAYFAEICSNVVGHIVNTRGRTIGLLSPWNEPSLTSFWNGTKAQFKTMVSVWAARIVADHGTNPRVPAPSTCEELSWTTTSYAAACIDQYAADGRQLGYIVLHDYNGNLNTARKNVQGAKAYASTAGYANAKVAIGEMGLDTSGMHTTYGWNRRYDWKGSARTAAYLHAFLCEMLNEGVDHVTVPRLTMLDARFPGEVDLGWMTNLNPPTAYPEYGVIQAHARAAGIQAVCSSTCPQLRVRGAADGDGVQRIVYGSLRWDQQQSGSLTWTPTVLGRPNGYIWRHYQVSRDTVAQSGELVEVGAGDEGDFPTAIQVSSNGVGLIEIAPKTDLLSPAWATITLGSDTRLPAGTSVSLYADNEANALRKGKPSGSSLQTAIVDANGEYAFTGLLPGREYQAYAVVAGQNVWTMVVP
jgi:hypothetical protein